MIRFLEAAGRTAREGVEALGFATRAFFNLLRFSPGAFRRPSLISKSTSSAITRWSSPSSPACSSAWCWACSSTST
jgi:hypothetical protein